MPELTTGTKLIAVIGSRTKLDTYEDSQHNRVGKEVHKYMMSIEKLLNPVWVSGGCSSGADYWVKKLCREYRLRYLEAVAFWDRVSYGAHGKNSNRPGLFRSETMAMVCHECVAFWDGKSTGTAFTMTEFSRLGKPVKVISINWPHPLDSLPRPGAPPRLSVHPSDGLE